MDSPDYADEGSPDMDVSRSYRDEKLDGGSHEKLTENERATGFLILFCIVTDILFSDVEPLQVITRRKKTRYLQICGRKPAGLS